MTQTDRDRLVALKKAKKKLITQKQAAEEIGVTERQVRRLLRKLRRKGDGAVIHELRGRASNRKLPAETEQQAVFGPAPGSATPPEHRIHYKLALFAVPLKQDISTLPGIGHFYFALTAARYSASDEPVWTSGARNLPDSP